MDQLQILSQLRSIINYHRICGVEVYPHDSRILDTLRSSLSTVRETQEGFIEEKNISGPPEKTEEIEHVDQEPGRERFSGLGEIAAAVAECRNCSLHESSQVHTAGRGGESPSLMVVGDWLLVPSGGAAPGPDDLFGREQDSMLERMIKAIHLDAKDVFITNVIKCSLPETRQPTAEHLTICSDYIIRQIEILSPKVICCMGIIAARILTGRSVPLSRQRGSFVSYKTRSGTHIPLMSTYHPTFLLRNPEMKKAVWSDLQAIRKELDRHSGKRS